MKKSASLISWLFSQHHSSRTIFSKQKISRLLLPVFFIVLLLAFEGKSWGQTILIDPAGDGGFETGATFALNGWTATTSGWATRNQFVCNTGATAGFSGTRCAYVTNNTAGTPPPHTYSTGTTRVTHIYRNFTVPACATNIKLDFLWIGRGETPDYDRMRVWVVPTTYTPVYGIEIPATGTAPTGNVQYGMANFNNQATWTNAETIILPNSYAGAGAVRLVFEWTNDAATGTNPPIGIDNISLTYTPPPPPCSGTPAPGNTVTDVNPVCANGNFTLSLQNTPGCGVTYQWQSSLDGSTWANIAGATSSTLITSQTAATYYHCLVTCSGNTGTSNSLFVGMTTCSAYYHPTSGLNSSSCGECMTLIGPGESHSYFDNGGPSANYANNINNAGSGIYRTFCPSDLTQAVRATFVSMNLESGYDILTIHNGASGSTSLPTLWAGSNTNGAPNTSEGNWSSGVQTSTDVSGCLTFRFDSDNINTRAGWEITLTTVPSYLRQKPVNSDCQMATTICNSSTITATSNGPGLISACPAGCLVAEYYTNWYVWKAGQAGALVFQITPNNGTDDYDFALYKATNCSVMGNPIRCSFYTTATGGTGLLGTETDTEENATGAGNGWVDTIHAKAEEYYFLMISDYTKEGTGFQLSFTGSTCNITCESPLPVELLTFDAKCNNDNVDLSWSTATETNNDYFTIERSADVSDWEFVKSVPGSGNSNSARFYSATDKDPLSGTSYYRLKQTDFDGHSETFSPVAVVCDDAGTDPQVNYSPNPFTSEVWVDFQNLNFENAKVTVYDVQGNLVYQKNISYTDFPDKKLNMNLSSLAAGIYMISFVTEDYTDTHRLVKKQ